VTPKPAIVVNFASRPSGCQIATNCGVEIADTGLQQGQGMHGSFSRADTYNFMAAMGPDFRSAFVDPVPASNADIGQTLADLLGLQLPSRGTLEGRILREAFRGGKEPPWSAARLTSEAGPSALKTSLIYETVGSTRYFDAAGFAGRTLGLDD
ncbi:MAG: hypothetical protein ABSF50_17795, partial [Burkholderiaceae bacterium]